MQFVRINIGKGFVRPRWGLFRKQKTRRNMQGEEVVLDEEVSGEGGREGRRKGKRIERKRFASVCLPLLSHV